MLINNDQQLRELIPNVFASVKGETSLFEKLFPFIAFAERWVIGDFSSQDVFNIIAAEPDDNITKLTAKRIIVCEALRNAVPSLDLVLTPNGFGIVSNTNIAPASKDRVERLVASLASQRDDLIEAFIPMLSAIPQWIDSNQYRFFSATLFPNIDLASLCGFKSDRWEKFLELRQIAIDIEASLAEEFFSPELMSQLRTYAIKGNVPECTVSLLRGIRAQVIDVLRGNPISIRRMIDLVNYIRNSPDDFPAWHNSATAKLFSPPKFSNKKDSKGYWF